MVLFGLVFVLLLVFLLLVGVLVAGVLVAGVGSGLILDAFGWFWAGLECSTTPPAPSTLCSFLLLVFLLLVLFETAAAG